MTPIIERTELRTALFELKPGDLFVCENNPNTIHMVVKHVPNSGGCADKTEAIEVLQKVGPNWRCRMAQKQSWNSYAQVFIL